MSYMIAVETPFGEWKRCDRTLYTTKKEAEDMVLSLWRQTVEYKVFDVDHWPGRALRIGRNITDV